MALPDALRESFEAYKCFFEPFDSLDEENENKKTESIADKSKSPNQIRKESTNEVNFQIILCYYGTLQRVQFFIKSPIPHWSVIFSLRVTDPMAQD